MKHRIIFSIGCLALLVAVGILVWRHDKIVETLPLSELVDTRTTVVATFYPLAYFAEQVGGEAVRVINLTPSGVEPHEYEPSPRDMAKAGEAKVVLVNGAGLDPWALKSRSEWLKNGQRVVVMSEALKGEAEVNDPHFWLDPVRVSQIMVIIRDQLIAVDPAQTELFKENTTKALARLAALNTDYTNGLATCAQREVVAAHDAYNYLANRYNLKLYAIAGLSPESEPSARRLADLSDLVKAKKITTIFFESLTSPKLADTLARETGVKTAVLNPIEGLTPDQVASGQDYDILMRENLVQLRLALVCQ